MNAIKFSGLAVVLAAAACASNPPARSANDQTTVKTMVADPTTLTSGSVSSVSSADSTAPITTTPHDVKPRWADSDILAATAIADAAQEDDAKLARERTKTARVERFALQVMTDQRDLDAQQARLARSIPATTSDLRSKVDDARRGITEAARSTSASYDRDFLAAQTQFAKTMIGLLDNEMIPSASNPELKSYLQAFRSKMASRLLQAQEITTQLP